MMQKVHFRLTSFAQKRCCLRSPIRFAKRQNGKTVVCKCFSLSQFTERQIEQPQDIFPKLSKTSLTYHKFVQRVWLFVSSWFEIHHTICLLFIQHRCCGKGFQLVVRRLRRKSNKNTFGYENQKTYEWKLHYFIYREPNVSPIASLCLLRRKN